MRRPRVVRAAALLVAVLGGVVAGCGDDPAGVSIDGRLAAIAEVRPGTVSVGQRFDVELTLANRTDAPVALPGGAGCRLSYEVRTSAGQVVAAPVYPCPATGDATLAPGAVLRETYPYEPGGTSFPRLSSGRYRVVPTFASRGGATGLVVIEATLTVR